MKISAYKIFIYIILILFISSLEAMFIPIVESESAELYFAEQKDKFGNTKLHRKIIKIKNNFTPVNFLKIKNLIELGFDINIKNNNGDTPLHLAIKKNIPELVKLLLYYGADKFIKNNDNYTPIDYVQDQLIKNLIETTNVKSYFSTADKIFLAVAVVALAYSCFN